MVLGDTSVPKPLAQALFYCSEGLFFPFSVFEAPQIGFEWSSTGRPLVSHRIGQGSLRSPQRLVGKEKVERRGWAFGRAGE